MEWFLAEIDRGDAYPQDLFWEAQMDKFIPLPGYILSQEYNIPRGRIQLYWRQAKSGFRQPLIWIDDKGVQQFAIDILKWVEDMKKEAYRPEHKTPLTSRLPFNYHYIPALIRNKILTIIFWLKSNKKSNRNIFPRSIFNAGCEIFLSLCNISNDLRIEGPLLVLTHDIDTNYGFAWVDKIASIEESLGFRSCWNVVPKGYRIKKDYLYKLLDCGHEIGMHGLWHNNREAFLSKERMRAEFKSQKGFIDEFKILGYRSPCWYRTEVMFQVLPEFFSYDLSCLDTDLVCPAGNGGVGFIRPFKINPSLIELPCTLPFELPLFWGITPKDLIQYWQPKIKFIKASKGMLLINTHPDPNYLGNNRLLNVYEKMLSILVGESWQSKLPRTIIKI